MKYNVKEENKKYNGLSLKVEQHIMSNPEIKGVQKLMMSLFLRYSSQNNIIQLFPGINAEVLHISPSLFVKEFNDLVAKEYLIVTSNNKVTAKTIQTLFRINFKKVAKAGRDNEDEKPSLF